MELTQCLTHSQFPQTFITNLLKFRIYPCKIPTDHKNIDSVNQPNKGRNQPTGDILLYEC